MLVDIDINKNAKVRVHKIHITGLDSLQKGETVSKLKRAMKKTHEGGLRNFFRSKKFLPEKYEEDKGLTIDRLNGWGYRDALIVSDSIVTIDPKHVDIYLHYPRARSTMYATSTGWATPSIQATSSPKNSAWRKATCTTKSS